MSTYACRYYDVKKLKEEFGWIDNYTTPKKGRYHEGCAAGDLSQTGQVRGGGRGWSMAEWLRREEVPGARCSDAPMLPQTGQDRERFDPMLQHSSTLGGFRKLGKIWKPWPIYFSTPAPSLHTSTSTPAPPHQHTIPAVPAVFPPSSP